jgi:hypothetical protein
MPGVNDPSAFFFRAMMPSRPFCPVALYHDILGVGIDVPKLIRINTMGTAYRVEETGAIAARSGVNVQVTNEPASAGTGRAPPGCGL